MKRPVKIAPDQISAGVSLALAGLIVYAGYQVYKRFLDSENRQGSDQGESVDELKRLDPTDRSRPVLTDFEIEQLSNSLYKSMYGPGTAQNKILETLQPLNGADLMRVIINYGTPTYTYFGYTWWGLVGYDMNLFSWLQIELEENYPEIFAKVKSLFLNRTGLLIG